MYYIMRNKTKGVFPMTKQTAVILKSNRRLAARRKLKKVLSNW